MWPSKARKSRSERGRSGASRRAPSTTSPPPSGAPAAMNATMSPSNPTSRTVVSLERADPRAGAGVVGHETHARTASSIFT